MPKPTTTRAERRGGEEGNEWIGEYTSTLSLTRQYEKSETLQIYLRTFNDPAVLEAEDKHKFLFNDSPTNPPVELTAVITAWGSNNGSASTILATHDLLQWESERLRELQEYLSARREVVGVLSAVSQTLTQLALTTTPRSESTPAAATTANKNPTPNTPPPPAPDPKSRNSNGATYPTHKLAKSPPFSKDILPLRPRVPAKIPPHHAGGEGRRQRHLRYRPAGARSGSSARVQMAKRIADKETVRMEMFGKEVAACLRSAGVTLGGVFALLVEVEGLAIQRKGKIEKEGETKIPVRRKEGEEEGAGRGGGGGEMFLGHYRWERGGY
ncbi:hypothetical protein HOY82DRAFT_634227 [Tuber indicum]|nr:hypothetical protein HOY82DRAFT_634227 [Tuber indicum]